MQSFAVFAMAFALCVGAVGQGDSDTHSAAQLGTRNAYEQHRQAAIRINDLAGSIRSEADATAYVSEIAGLFASELPPDWVQDELRHKISHAEYKSRSGSVNLIPEQHVVDVWNEYVRELGAPDEAIVTVAEIHNMRDAEFVAAQTGERKWHTAVPVLCAGFAFLLIFTVYRHFASVLLLFTLGSAFYFASIPCLWSIPTTILSDTTAAAAFGLITSVSQIGAFVGPSLVGYLNDRSHSIFPGIALIGSSYLVAAFVFSLLRLVTPRQNENCARIKVEPFNWGSGMFLLKLKSLFVADLKLSVSW